MYTQSTLMHNELVNIIHDFERRSDRWQLLEKEIANQKFDVTYWSAIKADTPRRGIARAHKLIVKWARENNIKEIIIAEDDFHFPAPDGFKYFIQHKPKNYDIYLGGIYTGYKEATKISDHLLQLKRFSGFHFYFIHSRFYDTFINIDTEINSIDNAVGELARQDKIKVYCVYPYAAIQNETKSDNMDGSIYYHKFFFNSENCYGWVK